VGLKFVSSHQQSSGQIQWCRRWGCKLSRKSFDLLKIRAKSLKICAKSLKTWVKSLKIWGKMALNVVWLQQMAFNVCRKKVKTIFKRSHQKPVGKCRTKTFRASLRKFGQKSFAPQNVACSYTYGQICERVARDWNSTFINVVKCILERYAFAHCDFGVSGFDPFLQLQTSRQLTPSTIRHLAWLAKSATDIKMCSLLVKSFRLHHINLSRKTIFWLVLEAS